MNGARTSWALLLGGLAIFTSAWPALAHRTATGVSAPIGAIAIPNLTHGQMQVIAANQSMIMELVDKQIPTDPTLRRLQGFVNLQRFVCLWGLVPGSVTDEDSPFNECAHAYLAATRALLLHVRAMPGEETAKSTLVQKVEREMLDHGASLVLCRYSDEPFNTGEIVTPSNLAAFTPTPLVGTGLAGIAAAIGFAWWNRSRQKKSAPIPHM